MWRTIPSVFIPSFEQIYATSAHFSWTDAAEFLKFCQDGGIPCKALPVEEYFQPGLCDGAFLTEEYTYDAHILRDYLMEEIAKYPGSEAAFRAADHRDRKTIRTAMR